MINLIFSLTTFYLLLKTPNLAYIYIFIVISYCIFILFFFNYIFSKKTKTQPIINEILFKDQEFLLFKANIFSLYYTSIIILGFFIFKQNGLNYFVFINNIDFKFIFILIIILIIYFLLFSKIFITMLFKLYLEIKNFINLLNETDFNADLPYSPLREKQIFKNKKFNLNLKRSYSSLSNNLNTTLSLDDTLNTESDKAEPSFSLAIKEFKKTHKGGYLGYLGYNLIHNFGNVSYVVDMSDLEYIKQYVKTLETKFKSYFNEIPEYMTYSIIPTLRRESENGDYKTISISNSIKINRYTSSSLLAEKVVHSILNALLIYSLKESNIELFIMGRPWLEANRFNVKFSEVTEILDKQIEKEISSSHLALSASNKALSEKALKLRNYLYSNVFMDNYGDLLLDKDKNLIGYKLNNKKYASVETYYNENNLLCNKITIREFDLNTLSFVNEPIDTWTDIRTEFGFIREYNKKKYFYNKSNYITNVEVNFSCPKFPTFNKSREPENKIGTIDLETFGSNLGLGYHQAFAAGFSIKDRTELFYIAPHEDSNEFIYKFFSSLFLYNKDLNNYTFYIHNLGRFYSIFILKALTKNKDFVVSPIWKDNAILSITINYFEKNLILFSILILFLI